LAPEDAVKKRRMSQMAGADLSLAQIEHREKMKSELAKISA
jgi:hypothetical protein